MKQNFGITLSIEPEAFPRPDAVNIAYAEIEGALGALRDEMQRWVQEKLAEVYT